MERSHLAGTIGVMADTADSLPPAPFTGMRTPARIGSGLRAARVEAGRSQADVAAEAGVSREALSLIENGRRGARVATLSAILDVLGYEIAFLPRAARSQRLRDKARGLNAG